MLLLRNHDAWQKISKRNFFQEKKKKKKAVVVLIAFAEIYGRQFSGVTFASGHD